MVNTGNQLRITASRAASDTGINISMASSTVSLDVGTADIFATSFQGFHKELMKLGLDTEPEVKIILSTLHKLALAAEQSVAVFENTGSSHAIQELNPWIEVCTSHGMTRTTLIADLIYLLELRNPSLALSLAKVIDTGSQVVSQHGLRQIGNFATHLGLEHMELEESFASYRMVFTKSAARANAILPTMKEILEVKETRQDEIDRFIDGKMDLNQRQSFIDEQFVMKHGAAWPNFMLIDDLNDANGPEYAQLKADYNQKRTLRLAVLMTQAERTGQKMLYSNQPPQTGALSRFLARVGLKGDGS